MFSAIGPMCHCLVVVRSRRVDSHNLGWTIFCLFGYLNLKIHPPPLFSHHFTCLCFGSLAFDSFFVLIFLQASCSVIWSSQWDVLAILVIPEESKFAAKKIWGPATKHWAFCTERGCFVCGLRGGAVFLGLFGLLSLFPRKSTRVF